MSAISDFLKLSDFQMSTGENVKISKLRHIEKDKFSGTINEIKDRDALEKYRLKNLYVSRDVLQPLNDGEYYFEDLQGLAVYDQIGEFIGKVRTALDYGAGSFLEIKTVDNKTYTIPFNKNSIITVDLQYSKIVIDKNYLLI